MFEIPLNKFEKEKKVIELHKHGKTIRQIAPEVHMAFRDISKIIKDYDKKMRLEAKKGEKKTRTKKPSISSQTFILFKEGKKLDEVKVLLDIPFKISLRYWKQYLKAIGMFEAFEFYEDHSYDIPAFLSINTFMKRNNISGNDIVNVLREANDVINLNQIVSNLKGEIERLQKIKNNYSLNQNNIRNHYLPPLGPLPRYYNW